ncbi:MAG: tripartite tricarboxylate transporter substrate binding protein [Betaproteobacteria bacterium]|nr:tripartite tricarboxylate transporter substrate binding protein [Betaproteobacteria bacterium]
MKPLTLPALGLALAAIGCASAAGYPTKPVRIIVPYAPGGGTDTAARIVAQKLTEKWQETFVVDNRPGAAGIVGTDIVAKAAPDGHTLLFAAGAHAINPALYTKLPYDAGKDFAPVAFVVTAPNILVVTPALPATSTKELIALAKAKPGQLNYGSGGAGQTPHLAAELFKSMAGIDMRHVPYKGGAPATADLLAGRISVMFGGMVLTLPHVKSGKLRALATTGARRAKAVPELPTISEAALPGYEADEWFGTWAPVGTPPAVSATLNGAIREILRTPAAQERFAGLGAEAIDMDTRAFGEFVRGQMAKWAKVIKDANIRAD